MKGKINITKRIILFAILASLVLVAYVALGRYWEYIHKVRIPREDVMVSDPGETMRVFVFFQNPIIANDPDLIECGKVFPVPRIINKTSGIAHESLNELLIGPTEEEKNNGYISAIPQNLGVHVNSVLLNEGTLFIEFDRPPFAGGSCALAGVTAQIEATAKQFPSVKDVKMYAHGSEEWRMNP